MGDQGIAPVCGAETVMASRRLQTADFDAFYALEYTGLLRLAIGLVDQRERAEELVHDAFERVLLRWDRLDNPGAFARTTLVNSARSELRRRSVARRWRPPTAPASELPDPPDQLLAALAQLTPKRRIAVVLRFVEDRSEAETAALMQCGVGTVKSLVSRGLADLRKVLQQRASTSNKSCGAPVNNLASSCRVSRLRRSIESTPGRDGDGDARELFRAAWRSPS